MLQVTPRAFVNYGHHWSLLQGLPWGSRAVLSKTLEVRTKARQNLMMDFNELDCKVFRKHSLDRLLHRSCSLGSLVRIPTSSTLPRKKEKSLYT